MRSISQYGYIAIEGVIGAGKSCLAERLAVDFNGRYVPEAFDDNPFLPKFYEDPERYAFPVELSFLAERFSQIKRELKNRNLFAGLVVADYMLDKSMIFASGNLSKDEFELFRKTFELIRPSVPDPRLVLYLDLPPDKLLENIRKRGRPYEQKITRDYLIKLSEGYLKFLGKRKNMKVLIVETEDLDYVQNQSDYNRMVDIICSPYPLGIHRIRP